MAHGQGATSNRRGGYGPFDRGPRGHGKDKSVKKAERRSKDERRVAAMEATRKAQEELDALIEEQKANPAEGAVAGAMHAAKLKEAKNKVAEAELAEDNLDGVLDPEPDVVVISGGGNDVIPSLGIQIKTTHEVTQLPKPKPRFSIKSLPQTGDGNFPFAVTMAKKMLREGYHIAYTLNFTGVGYEDVQDVEIDKDGWGIIPEPDEQEEASA